MRVEIRGEQPLRVGIYARVSSTDQACDVQLDALRAYARRRGASEIIEFVDHGVSGSATARGKRKALDALLGAAHRREIDLVVATKVDRVARSLRDLLTTAAALEAAGVGLVLLDQAGFDTSTPTGKFMLATLGAVAELERSMIRERQAAGIARARRVGTKSGRPFGQQPKVTLEVKARIERLRASGKSIREVAKIVGVSSNAVWRAETGYVPPGRRRKA